MRSKEFLLEYDRSREQQRIESLPAYPERLRQDPEFSLEKLESADPTPQKTYVPRLATWWMRGAKIEDLISTTADALEKYQQLKIKKKIKPDHADIGRFRTVDQFMAAVDQYQHIDNEFCDKVRDVTNLNERGKHRKIYQDDQLIVVKLLDKHAARWWGKNTKWCTSSTNNNRFNSYYKKGPVYVIADCAANTRYQLWWDKNEPYDEWEFRDAKNNAVNPQELSFFAKLQKIMEPLSPHFMWVTNSSDESVQLAAIQKDTNAIKYIKNPSEAVQLAAVKKNGWSIQHIKNPSEEVQLAAIAQDAYAIRNIIEPSEKVQLAAVQKSAFPIGNISNPTEAVQLAAIQKNVWIIQYIKNPTESAQLAAVKQNKDAIKYIENPTPKVKALANK